QSSCAAPPWRSRQHMGRSVHGARRTRLGRALATALGRRTGALLEMAGGILASRDAPEHWLVDEQFIACEPRRYAKMLSIPQVDRRRANMTGLARSVGADDRELQRQNGEPVELQANLVPLALFVAPLWRK